MSLHHVYLARHGQTRWNLERRRQGHLDSPLTEEGLRQAQDTASMATGLRVDAIFTSPLGRAQRTAEIISAAIGVEAISLPELAEIHHGVIAGLCYADIQRDHPDVIEGRRKDKYHYRFPGGESYADADTRARAALAALARSGSRYPLIVSHEMIGRMLLRNLLSQDVHEALQWQHPHNVIYGVDVRAGTVDRIQQEGLTLVWPREA